MLPTTPESDQYSESADVYAQVKAEGMFLPTEHTNGVFTSNLITHIVRDYDTYLRRSVERGMSAKELSISFLKEQKIRTKKSIEEIRNPFKAVLIEYLENWESQVRASFEGFAVIFGAERVVERFLQKHQLGSNTPSPVSISISISSSFYVAPFSPHYHQHSL